MIKKKSRLTRNFIKNRKKKLIYNYFFLATFLGAAFLAAFFFVGIL